MTISSWILTLLFVTCTASYYEESKDWHAGGIVHFWTDSTNGSRNKRAVKCDSEQFKCLSKTECISKMEVCDGTPHCKDSSDETFDLCSHKKFVCPPFAFRCSYGACVDGDAVCDGVVNCVDQSDELRPECGNNSAPNNCGEHEFGCLSDGLCIESSKLCDGRADCVDSSDETVARCSHIECPKYSFRCAYGACIDGDAKCNGVVDCIDGSDESQVKCKYDIPIIVKPTQKPSTLPPVTKLPWKKPTTAIIKPQVTSSTTQAPIIGGCYLPPQPVNGKYVSSLCQALPKHSSCHYKPGYIVRNGWELKVDCVYKSDEDEDVVNCQNGEWYPQPPTCSATGKCPALDSSNFDLICTSGTNNRFVSCNQEHTNGSIARFNCKAATHKLLKDNDPGYTSIQCVNGLWNNPLPDDSCELVCGRSEGDNNSPLIHNGSATELGKYPWHAGVYVQRLESYQLKCGATLISKKAIVSAAHCFYKESRTTGISLEKNLKIAVGKYYRELDDERDIYVQIRDVDQVHKPEHYEGSRKSYVGDIAVVTVFGEFEFKVAVLPICLDFTLPELKDDDVGQVVGWGLVSGQKKSDVLLSAKLPYIPYVQCSGMIPQKYEQFYRHDKFCAADIYRNIHLCQDDSGGGLVFLNKENSRFYLRGVVSMGSSVVCEALQVTLFTEVDTYKDLLQFFVSH